MELLLLSRGAAATRLPVLLHAPHRHGGNGGARRPLPELSPPIAEPRLAAACRRAVPQRPRGGGGGTPVRRGCTRDSRRDQGRTVVGLVRRAQAGPRVVRHAPRRAARPFHHVRKRNEVKRMRSYG